MHSSTCQTLARGRLDLFEACTILMPLARVLRAAHEKGVIHRDLKPDNVFLVELKGEAPKVKLLDFGGNPVDHRVDIYALGCVAFEMLAGRPPYVADNAMEMVVKHQVDAVPRVSWFVPDVIAEIDELIFRMLAKDRDGRPTIAQILELLERVGRRSAQIVPVARAIEDEPDAFALTRQRARAPARRPRRLVVYASLAAVVTAVVVVAIVGASPAIESSPLPLELVPSLPATRPAPLPPLPSPTPAPAPAVVVQPLPRAPRGLVPKPHAHLIVPPVPKHVKPDPPPMGDHDLMSPRTLEGDPR